MSLRARLRRPGMTRARRRVRSPVATTLALVSLASLAALPGAAGAAERWRAQVMEIDAAGLARAASEVSVQVVTLQPTTPQPGQQDQPAKQVDVQTVRSTASGVVTFAPPRPGQRVLLRFVEDGVEVNAPVEATGQVVGRYRKQLTIADVTLRVRANLEVRDSGLRAWLLYTFQTDKPGRLRWHGDAAIALPLLAPVVRGVVLDRGAVPAAARHMETSVEGDAKLERRGGALMLSGTIAPGRPISVRVRYPIGVAKATVALGIRGVVGQTHLAVAAIGVRPSRPRVLADRPSHGGRSDEGRDRMAGLALVQPVKLGEIARVWVTDLPVAATLPLRFLASAALLLALFALAAIVRRRG